MQCIFCDIASGKAKCYKVYEDINFLAFLDIRPFNPGHTLVIPKKHYRWVFDVPEVGEYWAVATRIAKAAMKALNAFSAAFITAGFEVPHAHIHVVPRFEGDGHGGFVNTSLHKSLSDREMQEITEKISKALNSF